MVSARKRRLRKQKYRKASKVIAALTGELYSLVVVEIEIKFVDHKHKLPAKFIKAYVEPGFLSANEIKDRVCEYIAKYRLGSLGPPSIFMLSTRALPKDGAPNYTVSGFTFIIKGKKLTTLIPGSVGVSNRIYVYQQQPAGYDWQRYHRPDRRKLKFSWRTEYFYPSLPIEEPELWSSFLS